MSSPEELTFVVGRWLRPIVVVLHVVRRMTFSRHLAVNKGVRRSIS